jgi:hypothetical protein
MSAIIPCLAILIGAIHPISVSCSSTILSSRLLKPPTLIGRENGKIRPRSQRYASVLDAVVSDLYRGGGDQSSNYNNNINANVGANGPVNGNEVPAMDQVPPRVPPTNQQFGDYTDNEPIYDGYRESVEDRLAAWRLQQQVCHIEILFIDLSLPTSTLQNHLLMTPSKSTPLNPQNRQLVQLTNKAGLNYLQPSLECPYLSSSSF